jgi:hypothetical protein
MHTLDGQGRGRVDGENAGMGMWRTQECGVEHARALHIVHKDRLSGDFLQTVNLC